MGACTRASGGLYQSLWGSVRGPVRGPLGACQRPLPEASRGSPEPTAYTYKYKIEESSRYKNRYKVRKHTTHTQAHTHTLLSCRHPRATSSAPARLCAPGAAFVPVPSLLLLLHARTRSGSAAATAVRTTSLSSLLRISLSTRTQILLTICMTLRCARWQP